MIPVGCLETIGGFPRFKRGIRPRFRTIISLPPSPQWQSRVSSFDVFSSHPPIPLKKSSTVFFFFAPIRAVTNGQETRNGDDDDDTRQCQQWN